jgi:hypothetical protein
MKFMLEKSSTVVDPTSLKHDIFKKILDADKEIGNKILLYVFLVCDISYDNPIRDVPYIDKQREAAMVIFDDEDYSIYNNLGKEWNDLTIEAIKCYDKEVVQDEDKDIYAYDKKMDQFREILMETVPRIEKNFGPNSISYSTNIEIINTVLEDIVTLIQTKASMVSMIVQGTVPKHLRGGLSPLTKGDINTKPNKHDSKDTTDKQSTKLSNMRSK